MAEASKRKDERVPEEASPQRQGLEELEFLCVDRFLTNMIAAQALKTAFARAAHRPVVGRAGEHDRPARGKLAGRSPGAVRIARSARLEPGHRAGGCGDPADAAIPGAMRFRDLLEAKLDFANLAAPDLIGLFPWLLVDPDGFMQRARIFKLFDYNRCLEPSKENYEATRRWMRFTTSLTRYEAPVCMRQHDFSRYAKMLDIGGNSGEFVLRVCKKHHHIRGTIFDLPLVCDVGREHVSREPEARGSIS